MGGEVSSFERDENTLLEQHIAFDHSAKSGILFFFSLCHFDSFWDEKKKEGRAFFASRAHGKQYVDVALPCSEVLLDADFHVFDDVERKVRELEAGSSYRASVEEPLVKKSLAEVYEEQFQKAQEGVDEKIAEIEKLMNDLFKKLDALSHFRYIPAEEVGPMASTDDVLMAPEEIKKHEKGAKMQRVKILSKRSREEQDVASSSVNKVSKKKKKKRRVDRDAADGDDRSTTENIKTTSFFKQLHQKVANEVGVLWQR
uniref:Uncharacterized protein n=1 Tax=Parascaris equorum TaxID=6256 RepID=A0A914RJY0_PAREQ